MARPKLLGMTISRLESMLNQQRAKKRELLQERAKLQNQLDKLDLQIANLDGGAGSLTAGGVRTRNAKSLVDTLIEVLDKHPKGLGITEIVAGVHTAGYKSSSPNFRGIVNQTLIKERKKFLPLSRGIYTTAKK
jgi:hypothetical protein